MDDLARRHQQIQAELAQIGITLPGSLTSRTTRCQRPGCHCRASPPVLHGPYPTWTRKAGSPLDHQDPHPAQEADGSAPTSPPTAACAGSSPNSKPSPSSSPDSPQHPQHRKTSPAKPEPAPDRRTRPKQTKTGRSARLTREPRPRRTRNPWSASSVVSPPRVTDRTAGVVPTELFRWPFLIMPVGSDIGSGLRAGPVTGLRQPDCVFWRVCGVAAARLGGAGRWWRWVRRAVSRLGGSRAGWCGVAVPGG